MRTAVWIAALAASLAFGQAQAKSEATNVSLSEAARIGLNEVGGGRVSEIAMGWEDGERAWEVEVIKDGRETEVVVDANSGSVVQVEEKGDISSRKQNRINEATFSAPQAMDQALAHAGGGRVVKMDIDQEAGSTVYEFDIERSDGSKEEVNIDATTGNVVESEGMFAFFRFGRERETVAPSETGRSATWEVYGYEEPSYDHQYDPYADWHYGSRDRYERYRRD